MLTSFFIRKLPGTEWHAIFRFFFHKEIVILYFRGYFYMFTRHNIVGKYCNRSFRCLYQGLYVIEENLGQITEIWRIFFFKLMVRYANY